jgi:gamma-glutamyltranspeptidase/glutathione hydrolase
VEDAIDRPRWFVSPSDWSVAAESRFEPAFIEHLRQLGHHITSVGPYDSLLGHAHAIQVTDQGYAAVSDPRSEGAALGL